MQGSIPWVELNKLKEKQNRMKTIKLMNSAVMPEAGQYNLKRIMKEEFVRILCNSNFTSYIGYPSTAAMIEKLIFVETGKNITVTICRDRTDINDGDDLLICRLKNRILDVNDKKKNIHYDVGDYEYFNCSYKKPDAVAENVDSSKSQNDHKNESNRIRELGGRYISITTEDVNDVCYIFGDDNSFVSGIKNEMLRTSYPIRVYFGDIDLHMEFHVEESDSEVGGLQWYFGSWMDFDDNEEKADQLMAYLQEKFNSEV